MRTATLRPHALAAGGDAIARHADGDHVGKLVFVEGALPDELVEVEVLSSKRDFDRARVLTVIEASPDRVAPPCPALAAGCGGCDWQHVDPTAQLRWKATLVADALRRIGRIEEPSVWARAAVSPWAYRTSVRTTVDAAGRLAWRAAASHRTVVPGHCAVVHPSIDELIRSITWQGRDRSGEQPEVSLRTSIATGERTAFASWGHLDSVPEGVSVGEGAVVHEEVAGHRLRVSAGSFFQSGPSAAELLVAAVEDAAADAVDAPGAIDGYGGVGLFSAALGLRAPVLVEGSAAACADARVNLADLGAIVHEAAVEEWQPQPAQLVIADPSRRGLGAVAAERLSAAGADTFVLVSCDVASLGRDAALLAGHGYHHAGSAVLDLFPQTSHVEAVTRFTRSTTNPRGW